MLSKKKKAKKLDKVVEEKAAASPAKKDPPSAAAKEKAADSSPDASRPARELVRYSPGSKCVLAEHGKEYKVKCGKLRKNKGTILTKDDGSQALLSEWLKGADWFKPGA